MRRTFRASALAGAALGTLSAWTFELQPLPLRAASHESWVFKSPALVVPQPPPHTVRLTAYCGCPECCGKWSTPEAITASGVPAREGVTIAADWTQFPEGTCLLIAGIGKRLVQDTGSAIKGAKLDVYFESHEEAKEFGFKFREVKPC